MRKIVVPVDFSASSIKAVEAAVTIARKTSGEVGLIHVNRVKSFASIFGSHKTADNVRDVERSMEELVKKTNFFGIPYTTTLRTGNASKEIAEYAEETSAFLIVLGTEAAGHTTETTWIGTEAFKILSSAPCPVICLPLLDKQFDLRKIIIPIDTTITTRHKVPFTAELANFFRAVVYVLGTCVDESPEFVSKLEGYCYQVRKFLNQANTPNEFEFVVGSNITKLCLNYAKQINADLVSVMIDQEAGLNLKSTVAQQLVQSCQVPVLSMHKSFEVEHFAY